MEYLFIQLMLWGKQEGYRLVQPGYGAVLRAGDPALARCGIGSAPLCSAMGNTSITFRVAAVQGEVAPEWEPKYLASPGGLALPRILMTCLLISGGLERDCHK